MTRYNNRGPQPYDDGNPILLAVIVLGLVMTLITWCETHVPETEPTETRYNQPE